MSWFKKNRRPLLEELPPPPPPPRIPKSSNNSTGRSSHQNVNSSGSDILLSSKGAAHNRRLRAVAGGANIRDVSNHPHAVSSASTEITSNQNLDDIPQQQQQSPPELMVYSGYGDVEMTGLDRARQKHFFDEFTSSRPTLAQKAAQLRAKVKMKVGHNRVESFERANQTMKTINENPHHNGAAHVPTVYFDDNSDLDSICSNDDVEWTPQDSSYGAACPVCGCIPKLYRVYIEYALMVVITATLVAFTVHFISPLTFFHSSHNRTAQNSTISVISSLTNDDIYEEYITQNTKAATDDTYYNQYLYSHYGEANDDNNYGKNNNNNNKNKYTQNDDNAAGDDDNTVTYYNIQVQNNDDTNYYSHVEDGNDDGNGNGNTNKYGYVNDDDKYYYSTNDDKN